MEVAKLRNRALGLLLVLVTLRSCQKFFKFLQWRRKLLQTFNIPPPSILLGNIGDMFRISGGMEIGFFEWMHAKHGEMVGFFLGPQFNISVANPGVLSEVYKKTRSRPYETYSFLHYLGKENLLFTHGAEAKEMRLRYGTMISDKEQLKKLHKIANKEFNTRTAGWGEKKEVDLFSELSFLLYDVMGQAFFGNLWLDTEAGPSVFAMHKYLIVNTARFMIPGTWLMRLPSYIKYKRTIVQWRELCNSLIEDHKIKMEQNPAKYENDKSALTMLLTNKNKKGELFFSRQRAISTMCGFLNGAYDTTHATCYWLFYHLAKHPDIQKKLKSEINRMIGGKMEFSLDEARTISYLQAFIYESMRMKSTVVVNQRVNYEEDLVLDGVVVPKGTCINIPGDVLMNSREYFGDDVDVFRPERFLPEDKNYEKAKKGWMAFGGHSRMCIGFTFALVELKVILISVLQQYNVELVDPDYNGQSMFEAGVTQPVVKTKFRFRPCNAQMEMEEKNREWWEMNKTKIN